MTHKLRKATSSLLKVLPLLQPSDRLLKILKANTPKAQIEQFSLCISRVEKISKDFRHTYPKVNVFLSPILNSKLSNTSSSLNNKEIKK